MRHPRNAVIVAAGWAGLVAVPQVVVWVVLVHFGKMDPVWGLAALGGSFAVLTGGLLRSAAAAMRLQTNVSGLLAGTDLSLLRRPTVGIWRRLWNALLQVDRLRRDQIDEAFRRYKAAETIIEGLSDPLMTLDRRGFVVTANVAARHLFGSNPEGRDIAVVLRHPLVLDGLGAVRATNRAVVVEFTWPGTVEREFNIDIRPLPARSNDLAVTLMNFHDVTAMKRSERMRADFVANASHEIRTPLAILNGFIETLRGPARDDVEARDRFLAIMHEQTQRLARLVNDLLSLSRIELNEHQAPTDPVDVRELLERVVATFELAAARRHCKLQFHLETNATMAIGARDELMQLFQNLIDNALKYGKVGKPVEIRLFRPAQTPPSFPRAVHGALGFSVHDQGDGIAREHLPRLTERFYRVDVARSHEAGGTGLGLAIVKHIVSRHRGALTIESEVGKGSVFTVFLPAAQQPEAETKRRGARGV